jgi:hypothetical protein
MPHPTTPSGDQEATEPSYLNGRQNVHTGVAEFKVIERPFTGTPLSSTFKSPFSSVKTEVHFPEDVIPTPPQSPNRSSRWKPLLHRDDPGQPVTPESQRYSKAPAMTCRRRNVGSYPWKGLMERLTDELSVSGCNRSSDEDTGNEEVNRSNAN